jgi:DNA-binding response OmpR family regulator
LKVLIVEDDDSVSRFIRQALTEAGYIASVAEDGPAGLSHAVSGGFQLILLDVMLGGMDGFEVCRRIRTAGVTTPILMLTARDLLDDKVRGLDSGADDYLVKPFKVAELLARMRALLRRPGGGPGHLQLGDLILDPAARQVSRSGRPITLSATEYTLLEYLMRNAGRTLTRSMILEHVWHYDFEGNDKVLDVYISYLRRKIDDGDRSLIHTMRGVGYRLEACESERAP